MPRVRYYVEQSKNWLFFTTFLGTKGWRLDLDDQILLGGDNGLRGYPLRYQDGTERALWTVEQRYFTDWYPFRLFRVGARRLLRCRAHLGQRAARAAEPRAAQGCRLRRCASAMPAQGSATSCTSIWPFRSRRPPASASVQFLVQTEKSF